MAVRAASREYECFADQRELEAFLVGARRSASHRMPDEETLRSILSMKVELCS